MKNRHSASADVEQPDGYSSFYLQKPQTPVTNYNMEITPRTSVPKTDFLSASRIDMFYLFHRWKK